MAKFDRMATKTIWLFLILGGLVILALVASTACSDGGSQDLPAKTYSVIDSFSGKSDVSTDDYQMKLKQEDVSSSDAQKIAQAIVTTLNGDTVVEKQVKRNLIGLPDNANASTVAQAIVGVDVDSASNGGNTNDPDNNNGDNTNDTGSSGNTTPSPADDNKGTNSGNAMTKTSCGTIQWGPAGPAPGSDTSDSGQQVREAADTLQSETQYLTVHKYCPGDDTPNGWVVGTSGSEAAGINVSAGFLPAGVCVDYDPHSTTIVGNIAHTQVLTEKWSRSLLAENGSVEKGLKFTVYWTPCVFTDGYNVSENAMGKSAQTTASGSCPTNAAEASKLYGGNASNWKQNPQYSNGWIYNGPVIPGFAVPKDGKVDYDGGSTTSGSVPSGSAFTAWCPK